MKQFLLLSTLTVLAGVGALTEPFWGVLLYYFLAVLRPQHLWEWAMPVQWRWSLAAALIVLICGAVNLHLVLRRARLSVLLVMMIVFGGLLMMSCLTARDPAIAADWGIDFGKVLLIAVVSSLLIHRTGQVQMLAASVLLSLGYIAYEVNYTYLLQGGRLDIFHYGYGGLDNNGAGLLLAMGIPFAYAYAAGPHPRFGRLAQAAATFAVAVLIHAIMLTYSRGAMLAAMVGALWLLIHHRPRAQSLAMAALLIGLVSFMAGPEVRDRFESTTQFHEDDSAQARLASWGAGWKLAWEKPFTGHGLRNSQLVMHTFDDALAGRTIHSLYIQMAADSGIPAVALFIGIIALTLWRLGGAARTCGATEPRDDTDDLRLGLLQRTCRAAQASMLTYAFGGVFLSIEVFELAWLLIVVAAVLPPLLREEAAAAAEDQEQPSPESQPTGAPVMPRLAVPRVHA